MSILARRRARHGRGWREGTSGTDSRRSRGTRTFRTCQLQSLVQCVHCRSSSFRRPRWRSRLEDRWMEDLFFGVQDRSDEVVIGTRDIFIKGRTVMSLDGVQRIHAELVRELRGSPWDLYLPHTFVIEFFIVPISRTSCFCTCMHTWALWLRHLRIGG